ncbi:unnamed protein product [Ambrosiozyma monospora]|uniref:Unnamed protein product n=1 Tax=Ambrosiozyma monospora TaxID=43982 RepID=A0ACB5STS7_AMBMO|nr:unnamed protein product [Ambrosiozyma monospora]
MEIPPVTRTYVVGVVSVSIMEYTGYLTRADCFYSYDSVFVKGEYWRLLTTFLYFGRFSLDLVLTLYVLVQHSKPLELSFINTRDYVWFIGLLASILLLYSTFYSNLFILGTYLKDCMLYIWSRRNPDVEVSIMGVLNFKSIYIPFVSLTLNKVLSITEDGISISSADFASMVIGHFYIFFNDMFPKLHSCESPLKPIWYWFEKENDEEIEVDDEPAAAENIDEDPHPLQNNNAIGVERGQVDAEVDVIQNDTSVNEQFHETTNQSHTEPANPTGSLQNETNGNPELPFNIPDTLQPVNDVNPHHEVGEDDTLRQRRNNDEL